MSLWQFGAALQGWQQAHGDPEKDTTLSEGEVVEISDWLDRTAGR
jgi:hypothetical protein